MHVLHAPQHRILRRLHDRRAGPFEDPRLRCQPGFCLGQGRVRRDKTLKVNIPPPPDARAAIGASVWTPTVPGELGRAHGIVVPGVGHFDSTKALTDEWRTAIKTMADDGVPLLGICVGLQWLFDGSAEAMAQARQLVNRRAGRQW